MCILTHFHVVVSTMVKHVRGSILGLVLVEALIPEWAETFLRGRLLKVPSIGGDVNIRRPDHEVVYALAFNTRHTKLVPFHDFMLLRVAFSVERR